MGLSGVLVLLHLGILESGGTMDFGAAGPSPSGDLRPLGGWPWLLLGGAGFALLALYEARRVEPITGRLEVDLWVDAETFRIRRVRLVELDSDPREPTVWTLGLSAFDRPVEIRWPDGL